MTGRNVLKSHRSRKGRAFTLVELLLSIALIAVLCVFMVGVSLRALQRARDTRCVGSLRHLVRLGLAYAGDQNGLVLNSFDPTWYVTLRLNQPDFTNRETFHCAENPLRSMPGTATADGKYGLNYGYAYGLWNTVTQRDSFRISRITKPGLKVMFSDGIVPSGATNPVAWYSIRSDDIAALPRNEKTYFHDRAIHIGFYDGSVRRVPMEEVDYRWWGMSYQQ